MIFKRSGKQATIHQFCNDWITYTMEDGRTGVAPPTSVILDVDEIEMIRAAAEAGRTGTMFLEFELTDYGRFIRRRRR